MVFVLFLLTLTTTWADTSLRFGLSQNQFAGEPQAKQIESDQNWSVSGVAKKQESGWSSGAEVLGYGSFQNSWEQYVGVPELYFKIKNKSNILKEREWSMTIGRERRLWSHLDDQLSLGVWQPALRWDAMRPVSEGLTGLFFDIPITSKWSMTLMTSPLFIPDQGANFRLQEGKFESHNRWFRQPISHLEMMGATSSISYELEKPDVKDVVFQSSFATSLRFEENGFWAQASAAYMPSNQLHLGLGKYQSVSLDPGRESVVRVFPRTYKHNIFTLETGLKRVNDEAWISFMTDYPQRPEFKQKNEVGIGWEESELSRKNYVGVGYQQKLPSFWGVNQSFQVSLLRGWKIALPQNNSNMLTDQPVPSSFDRPFYEKLVALDWMLAWKKYKRQHWDARLRYWQTFDPRSAWISPMFTWVDDKWNWTISADLLGAEGSDDLALKTYFGQYRNNSRLMVGLSYVF